MNVKIMIPLAWTYFITLILLIGYGKWSIPSDILRNEHTTVQEINAQGQVSKEWKYVEILGLRTSTQYVRFFTGKNEVTLSGINYRIIYLQPDAK